MMAESQSPFRCSLIVPMFNELDNVEPLLTEVFEVLRPAARFFEVIVVDDGSTDGTGEQIQKFAAGLTGADRDRLRTISLARNCGQSAAILVGVEQARTPLVATMDGDLQNDPRDILVMLERLDRNGCDGVTGVRTDRRDGWVRRWSSRIGNAARNWITGDRVVDSGCGIRLLRRDQFLQVPRFHGMHRFMPTLIRYVGGAVDEIPVSHRPRVAGAAKYGVGNRMWRGLRDCFAVRWMRSRLMPAATSTAFVEPKSQENRKC